MQIVLISKSSKKSRTLTLGTMTLSVLVLFSVAVGLVIFHFGELHAFNMTRNSFKELYMEVTPPWREEIASQQQMLEKTKLHAEKNLDALAAKLSTLQTHVMRLDALGSRLARMADLNEIEFDFDATIGLGGPEQPSSLHSTLQFDYFLTSLEQLNVKIQDRSEKLSAMESMLMDRALRQKTIPAGSPTEKGWVSSLFGDRTDPITGKVGFHAGIDYAGKIGSPILAVASGIVTWEGIRHGYGNVVEISHGNGYQTLYAHNKSNLVAVGQKVDRGQVIALMGTTGRSTGSHVHFEVLSNGEAVNPKKYISLQ